MRRPPTARALLTIAALCAGLFSVGAGSASADAKVDVFIGFDHRPGRSDESFVRGRGGHVRATYRIVDAIAASVPEHAVDGIARSRGVTYVEPIGRIHVLDHGVELANTWGVDRIQADVVHHGGNLGGGVRVGVLDTGIDTDHPDVAYTPSCSADFSGQGLEDLDGHGTHTAGTVGATKNGFGVVGVGPSVTLCIYKVLGNNGSGSFDWVVSALQRAAADGVKVTNNSYGASGDPGITVRNAFAATASQMVHAGSAGNSGNPPGKGDNCGYPARYDSVLAVAATTSSDNRASYSSTCAEVELAAPGSSVRSTVPGGGYANFSGTSMASPHVAGSAALVFSATPGATPAQVRAALTSTAQDLGSAGRDTQYGFGLVRPDLAVGGGSPPATGSVAGVVTDAGGGSPIAGASVSVDTGQVATTAADGSYAIAGVPVGDRTVTASASGYASSNTTVTVTDGGTATANLALDAVATGSTVSVASISYATSGGKANDKHLDVTVALVDDLGQAVAGASVSIDLQRNGSTYGTGTGTTGTDGRVTFSAKNAPSGSYSTQVTAVSASGLSWDGVTPSNGFVKP